MHSIYPFFIASSVLLVSSSASAEPRLLIADQVAGTVLEFTEGGDVSGNVFASGLSQPAGLCVGPGSDLYVAEFGAGEVTIISAGGDMTDVPAFADAGDTGIGFEPVGLWCDADRVLVVDFRGVVADITVGGSDPAQWANGAVAFAPNPFPTDLARTAMGNAFAASGLGIYLADPGVAPETPPVVVGHPFVSLKRFGDQMLAGANDGPRIFDVTAGGDLSAATPWATLPGDGSVFALLDAGEQGRFAATGTAIYDVSAGGDLTAAAPFATGLSAGLVYEGMTRWVCGSDADCDDGDPCNGVERCGENRCLAPTEPLVCDDRNLCTTDSCEAGQGCAFTPIEGCCGSDSDCSVDEICDGAQGMCVPAFDPSGGDASGGGSTSGPGDESSGGLDPTDGGSGDASGGPTSDGGGSSGGDTDAAGAESGAGGCRAGGGAPPSLWLLGLVAVWRGRRTSRRSIARARG